MTQFSSSLYPQTNPTNPVLLKFREIPKDFQGPWRAGFLAAQEHVRFAAWTDEQADHAARVLKRLAALSG